MYEYHAVVDRVVDGDTLDVTFDLGLGVFRRDRIRLFGVDTPETFGPNRCPRGAEATAFVRGLVEDRRVVIRTFKDKTGKYGRYLGVVFFKAGLQWANINVLLVEQDMAEKAKHYDRIVHMKYEGE